VVDAVGLDQHARSETAHVPFAQIARGDDADLDSGRVVERPDRSLPLLDNSAVSRVTTPLGSRTDVPALAERMDEAINSGGSRRPVSTTPVDTSRKAWLRSPTSPFGTTSLRCIAMPCSDLTG